MVVGELEEPDAQRAQVRACHTSALPPLTAPQDGRLVPGEDRGPSAVLQVRTFLFSCPSHVRTDLNSLLAPQVRTYTRKVENSYSCPCLGSVFPVSNSSPYPCCRRFAPFYTSSTTTPTIGLAYSPIICATAYLSDKLQGVPDIAGSTSTNLIEAVTVDLSVGMIFRSSCPCS